MKQLFHTLLLCGSLLALASCAATDLVDEPGTAPEAGDVTVIATLEQTTGTRTGHAEADPNDPTQGVKVTWASGDAIGIQSNIDSSPTSTFTFAGMTKDGTSGIFSGKGKPAIADSYRIFYPATAQCTNGHIDFGMTGQTQWGDGSMVHLGAYDVMLHNGAPDWTDLTFVQDDHLNALMTFDLTNIPADLGTPQSITLGCTGDNLVFYDNTTKGDPNKVSKLKLKLSGFAVPTGSDAISIKAYLMFVPTSIPAQESLTITIDGDREGYTFTSAQMTEQKDYSAGKRYTIAASTWEKTFLGATYTGKEARQGFTGKGTSTDDPYVIATAGQLRTLIEEVNSGNRFSDGKFFRLDSDIRIAMTPDVNDGKWIPIGLTGENKAFYGTFDGNGHTICGSMTGAKYLGFFGKIEGATIRNLTVDATVSGTQYVGGVAGYSHPNAYNYIINCINKGAVTCTISDVGGIIGLAYKTYIYGCINQGTILLLTGATNDDIGAGGIAGQTKAGIVGGCYNTGAVTIPTTPSGLFVCRGGGIVGVLQTNSNIGTEMFSCYNTGKIQEAKGYIDRVGAIAGYPFSGTYIDNCQYVVDPTNGKLNDCPFVRGSYVSNCYKRNDLAALNGEGVVQLNSYIQFFNRTNSDDPKQFCPFHFVAGTTAGPTLVAGAPE